MKALKPKMSVRSLRSTRSAKSQKASEDTNDEICSLDNLLLVACAKYSCPYLVTVKKETKESTSPEDAAVSERNVRNHELPQNDYYKMIKGPESKGRAKRMSQVSPKPVDDVEEAVTPDHTPSLTTSVSSVNNIIIHMLYDSYNLLTEISISKTKRLPRILVKIIGLLIPYYRNLTKLTLQQCGIDMFTIYELGKLLKSSSITEICLDGSPIRGADYTMLLESTNLQNLSLRRCNIYDDTCQVIASKLHHEATADNLLLLNLSTNRITDQGAKYIADALRTNRHLRYLNLSDNHITDEGAAYLLDVLIEFPLSYDEIMNMRRRRMEYLKCKETVYQKYLNEYRTRSFDEFSVISRKSAKRKRTSATTLKTKVSIKKERESATEEFIKSKAEIMANGIVGPFKDPFHSGAIREVNGYTYSIGNMTLAYLNLAYNNLSFLSIKKLLSVITHQRTVRTSSNQGLVKVVIEGNNLPINCSEMITINDLMTRTTARVSKISGETSRRKK